jgi:hypothetical protein
LADGSWSAPSAIGTVGGGFGGQIGFELTDFVFILNDASAVKTFAQVGSLTLGGNVSIAAGPVGRNAEAAGAASLKSVSGIFAYSKTKGLFAGVSLEGSVLIERRDANEKMYNRRVTARACLEGSVPVPPAAEPLTRVLNSRVFAGRGVTATGMDGAMYNDIPVYNDAQDDVVWQGRTGSAYGEGVRTDRTGTGTMAVAPMGARANDSDYNFATTSFNVAGQHLRPSQQPLLPRKPYRDIRSSRIRPRNRPRPLLHIRRPKRLRVFRQQRPSSQPAKRTQTYL